MAGVDLEKELTCSICTEVLYQPLTLLDCLHTFCGSCLKEWFAWQAAHPSTPHTFTCPSCRAPVRETRPNATVTTLLDMYLQANPARSKTESERDDIAKSYKPGDVVLPQIPKAEQNESDEEDQRLLAEVRERSLRDVRGADSAGGTNFAARERNRGDRGRNGTSDSRSREDRSHRRRERRDASGGLAAPSMGARSAGHSPSGSTSRQVGHQSSLRDLLSAEAAELQEEIMREIMEGGLLDGIDLDHIDVAQEDEISERIAEACRQRLRRQQDQTQTETPRVQRNGISEVPAARSKERETNPRTRSHARSQSDAVQSTDEAARSTRTHLEVATSSGRRRRRASANSRSDTSPHIRISPASRSSSDLPMPAGRSSSDVPRSPGRQPSDLPTSDAPRSSGRSSTDLTDRPRSRMPLSGTTASGQQRRSVTDPERRHRSESTRRDASRGSRDGRTQQGRPDRSPEPPVTSASEPTHPTSENAVSNPNATEQSVSASSAQTLQVPPPQAGQGQPRSKPDTRPTASSRASSAASLASHPILYQEPLINCESCGKTHIEYLLHYNCSKCKGGNYNICINCFRLNKGCLHWFGFGLAAIPKYYKWLDNARSQGLPLDEEGPHRMRGRRYLPPRQIPFEHPVAGVEVPPLTLEDPNKRVQSGMFCDICFSAANDCYWVCDVCNEGEWGFCNRCVNQGRCCTHSLLPTRFRPAAQKSLQRRDSKEAELQAPIPQDPQIPDEELFEPLMFGTRCNVCKLTIQPAEPRLHCPQCNDGDYDICTKCYKKLSANGQVSQENGEKGWRRCLEGHRMIITIVGFQDRDGDPRRVVVKDLVGGVALKDEGDVPATGSTLGGDHVYSWTEGSDGRRHSRRVSKGVAAGTSGTATSIVTTQFPPSGGVGGRAFAVWSWFPLERGKQDLVFPRGAEIREIGDYVDEKGEVNGDWPWGVYAGQIGIFPIQHVQML